MCASLLYASYEYWNLKDHSETITMATHPRNIGKQLTWRCSNAEQQTLLCRMTKNLTRKTVGQHLSTLYLNAEADGTTRTAKGILGNGPARWTNWRKNRITEYIHWRLGQISPPTKSWCVSTKSLNFLNLDTVVEGAKPALWASVRLWLLITSSASKSILCPVSAAHVEK